MYAAKSNSRTFVALPFMNSMTGIRDTKLCVSSAEYRPSQFNNKQITMVCSLNVATSPRLKGPNSELEVCADSRLDINRDGLQLDIKKQ